MRLHHKWVEFLPHPNSLDGSARPSEEKLKELGFLDINNALAGTVAALQNTAETAAASKEKPISRKELTSLVGDVVSKENSKLRVEFKSDMTALKEELIVEAHSYVDHIDAELRVALSNLEAILSHSTQVVSKLVRPAITATDPTRP